MTKRCSGCKTEKAPTEFYKRAKASDGLDYQCKACTTKRGREYYVAHNSHRRRSVQPNTDGSCGRCDGTDRLKNGSCRACNRLWVKRWQLQSRYGMSLERYEELLRAQGGTCAVCQASSPAAKRMTMFAVDHCHKTGKVRGLLCHKCNPGLGYFDDDIEKLQKAQDYLRRSH